MAVAGLGARELLARNHETCRDSTRAPHPLADPRRVGTQLTTGLRGLGYPVPILWVPVPWWSSTSRAAAPSLSGRLHPII